MDVLPYNFRACQIGGIWYESNRFFALKAIYTITVMFVIIQFTFSLILHLATMEGDVDEFTEVLFLAFNFVALCWKIFNFVSRREEMADILADFRMPFCQPKSAEEEMILQGFSKTAAKIFLFIMTLSESSAFVIMTTPLFSTESNETLLPFKAYQPYNVSNPINFWITYAMQFFSGVYGVMLDVSLDTMMYGFIIMATGQFEINCFRLENSTRSIKHCVEHHLLIQNIVDKIQYFYIPVIVPLFFFSLITLCTSIFQMSQKPILSFEFWSLVSYVITMLCQVFLYCWFGNELELKSKAVASAIYSSEWVDLTIEERKNMWFVMLSAQNGSNISFHGQCNLSVNTFIWVVKTAYAALSLLQQASA